ncbi:hypothetical protein Tco_1386177 [Tanacetum coccineum]
MIRSLTAEPQMDEIKLSFAYGVWYLIGKLDDATLLKLLKSNRPGSEKNGRNTEYQKEDASNVYLHRNAAALQGDGCKSKKEAEQLVACVVISKLFSVSLCSQGTTVVYTNRSSNSGNDSSCSCGDLTACSRITGLIGSMESPRQGIRIATCESNFKKKMKSEKQEKGQYKMRLEAQMSGQPCS